MKLYELEITSIDQNFGLVKFNVKIEGKDGLSTQGTWIGSNGSLICLKQDSGYWKITIDKSKLTLWLLDSQAVSSGPHFSLEHLISLSGHDPLALAMLDIPQIPLGVGLSGTGNIPRYFSSIKLSFRVTDRGI